MQRPATTRVNVKRGKYLVIVALFFYAVFMFGCTASPDTPAPPTGAAAPSTLPWAHLTSDLDPDPAVSFGQLPNGFRYVIMENAEPAGRVSMHLNIQVGSLHENEGEEGTAHFLEHMLFNGSTNFQPGELVKYFQRIGMQFGPDANAHTGFRETVYDILLADNSAASIAEGLLVLNDYAQGALLLESEVERERDVILAEKRTRDSVDYRTWVATAKFEMPDALVPLRMPIGTQSSLESADRASLKGFYDAWYRPEKMMVVLVGDIEADQVEKMIAASFSDVRARSNLRQPPEFGSVIHTGDKSFYHFEKEADKTSVRIETLRASPPFKDNRAYRQRRLLEEIGRRIMVNRLDARIGKKGTPYTEGTVGVGLFLNKMRYSEIAADCSPANWEKTLVALEVLLRQALVFGFSAVELDRVKKDILAELEHAVKRAPTRQSPMLSRHLIRKINAERVILSPAQELELLAPMLMEAALPQVNAAFRDSWAADHRLILVTGNADLATGGAPPEQLILDRYALSRAKAVQAPAQAARVEFPYLAKPPGPGQVLQTRSMADLGIVQLDLSNGVRVNLKQTDFEADQVAIRVDFGSGRSHEPEDRPGLGPLTESIVNESALGALDKDALERALAGKNLSVDFKVAEDSFYFKGKCAQVEIETLVQLLYAHLVDPGFREDAFQHSLEKFNQRYLALEKSVNGALTLAGLRFLAGGDTRFGLPPRKQIQKLTLADVKAWLLPALKQGPLEVSVVGDFNLPATRALLTRYFGHLPAREPAAGVAQRRPPTFPSGQTLTTRVQTRLPKGLTIVAYPTADVWDIKRTRRLSVLGEVISERLRVGIREKLGAAYTTAAFNRPGRAYAGYGVFLTYVQVAPDQVALIRDEVRKIVQAVVANGITTDELKRALDPTLSGIRDARRRNGYWLNTVMAGSRAHPEQLQWSRDILADYAGITVAEVEAAAQKYLVNGRSADILATSADVP